MDHATDFATKRPARCGPHSAKQGPTSQPHSNDEARPTASALDILDERFARGEIDKAEYVEKKQLISQRAPNLKFDQPEQVPVVSKSTSGQAKQ